MQFDPINRRRQSLTYALAGLLAITATLSVGCSRFVNRAQSPDDTILSLSESKQLPESYTYISDVCKMYGMNSAKIEGIGLATNLAGTGSVAKPGSHRDHLHHELKTREAIEDPKELMASKDTAMVILRGSLPAGIRKGDLFDIEVICTPNSDATSLTGGTVLKTRMRPLASFGNTLKEGHTIGLGRGSVLVDSVFESRQDQPNDLHGVILGGGVALEDRPLGLTVRTQSNGASTTMVMSRAINARFTYMTDSGREGVANPKTDRVIELQLPKIYSTNVSRYSRVIANMAFAETSQKRVNRLDKLAKDLTDPALATIAALRLEAIGDEAVPTLKRALNNPDREIRFSAAEALAYCGHADGLSTLTEMAADVPAFRRAAMTAIGVIDSSAAVEALVSLTQSPSAETRYGAFRTLREVRPDDPLVQGEWISDFYLHSLPGETDPMIHFSRRERPEIAIFGDAHVGENFIYVESGTTIRSQGDGTISIKRYRAGGKPVKDVCGDSAGELIAALVDNNFGYGQIINAFRQAKSSGDLDTRLVVDAIPRFGRTYDRDEETTDDDTALDESKYARVATELVNSEGAGEEVPVESKWDKIKPKIRIGDYIAR